MVRVARAILWLALPACLFLGAGCSSDNHQPTGPGIYTVVLEQHGKTVERKLNLANAEDRRTLDELLASGEVEEIIADKEPNLLGLKWDLGLWTLVVFVLLCLILKKTAWGPMLEGLQKREHLILSAIEDAKKARAEADALRQQFQTEMAQAQDRVNAMIEEGRRNAQRTAEEETAKARAVMQEERERMHRELQLAKDQALQELWSQTARLATMISSKAIKRHLNEDDHRRLVDEALTELGQQSGNWKRQQLN